jgi:carbon storage regulator CsrA
VPRLVPVAVEVAIILSSSVVVRAWLVNNGRDSRRYGVAPPFWVSKQFGLTRPSKRIRWTNRLNGGSFVDSHGGFPYRQAAIRRGIMDVIIIPRKKGESIVIGDNIIVTIVDIEGDMVRISIEHPPEVTVERYEVLESLAIAAPPR